VDFEERKRILERLKRAQAEGPGALIKDILLNWRDGSVKLYLISRALNFRRSHSRLFQEGEYIPLYASGRVRENVCAFARRMGDEWVVAVAPRLVVRLGGAERPPLGKEAWGDSALPLPPQAPARWRNILTGEELATIGSQRKKLLEIGTVLQNFPVALLTSERA
jgi:(1->4)-alpha-D-glucan 1-alpha-D-glucosylmutase